MTTKPALLIWGGPVYANTPKEVAWQCPMDFLVLAGAGSTHFSNLAEQYRGPDGRILDNILAAHGKSRGSYRAIAIAGFSAWHGMANKLLEVDGDKIDAAIALDSCFSAMTSLAKKGYASFARRAAGGSRLFVLTAGPGGGPGSGATVAAGNADFSTARQCIDASLMEGGVKVAGMSPFQVPPPLPQPVAGAAFRRGSLYVLDYANDMGHEGHVHKLAVPVMQAFLAPYLARSSSALGAVAFVAGLVGGVLLADYL